ncbi:MAG: hypothetical protein FWD68_08850 [Alphaproteobacteria bacterium]|nr:hypothetical protein [Alphaproteobacteria bacterium]
MRRIIAAGLVAFSLSAVFAGAACADILPVPPVKGNDTGGIIAYSVATRSDVREIAVEHCARYGKVAKFLGAQAYDGGYISFACRWVPYEANPGPRH